MSISIGITLPPLLPAAPTGAASILLTGEGTLGAAGAGTGLPTGPLCRGSWYIVTTVGAFAVAHGGIVQPHRCVLPRHDDDTVAHVCSCGARAGFPM